MSGTTITPAARPAAGRGESATVARVRAAIAAARQDPPDMGPAHDLHAEAMVIHGRGATSPLAGTIRGRAEALRRVALLRERSGHTFVPTHTSVVGGDDIVAVMHHVTARRGERRLDQTLAELWRFEDGACVEVWVQYGDPAAWDAFWA